MSAGEGPHTPRQFLPRTGGVFLPHAPRMYLLHTLHSLFNINRGFSPCRTYSHTGPKRGDDPARPPPPPPRANTMLASPPMTNPAETYNTPLSDPCFRMLDMTRVRLCSEVDMVVV